MANRMDPREILGKLQAFPSKSCAVRFKQRWNTSLRPLTQMRYKKSTGVVTSERAKSEENQDFFFLSPRPVYYFTLSIQRNVICRKLDYKGLLLLYKLLSIINEFTCLIFYSKKVHSCNKDEMALQIHKHYNNQHCLLEEEAKEKTQQESFSIMTSKMSSRCQQLKTKRILTTTYLSSHHYKN
jgi:hypothetical protein